MNDCELMPWICGDYGDFCARRPPAFRLASRCWHSRVGTWNSRPRKSTSAVRPGLPSHHFDRPFFATVVATRKNKKHLKNVRPIRLCEPPHADVHNNNNDDDDNAWQRVPLWPDRMGPITVSVLEVGLCCWRTRRCRGRDINSRRQRQYVDGRRQSVAVVYNSHYFHREPTSATQVTPPHLTITHPVAHLGNASGRLRANRN